MRTLSELRAYSEGLSKPWIGSHARWLPYLLDHKAFRTGKPHFAETGPWQRNCQVKKGTYTS